jgi:hypothetical protein
MEIFFKGLPISVKETEFNVKFAEILHDKEFHRL